MAMSFQIAVNIQSSVKIVIFFFCTWREWKWHLRGKRWEGRWIFCLIFKKTIFFWGDDDQLICMCVKNKRTKTQNECRSTVNIKEEYFNKVVTWPLLLEQNCDWSFSMELVTRKFLLYFACCTCLCCCFDDCFCTYWTEWAWHGFVFSMEHSISHPGFPHASNPGVYFHFKVLILAFDILVEQWKGCVS